MVSLNLIIHLGPANAKNECSKFLENQNIILPKQEVPWKSLEIKGHLCMNNIPSKIEYKDVDMEALTLNSPLEIKSESPVKGTNIKLDVVSFDDKILCQNQNSMDDLRRLKNNSEWIPIWEIVRNKIGYLNENNKILYSIKSTIFNKNDKNRDDCNNNAIWIDIEKINDIIFEKRHKKDYENLMEYYKHSNPTEITEYVNGKPYKVKKYTDDGNTLHTFLAEVQSNSAVHLKEINNRRRRSTFQATTNNELVNKNNNEEDKISTYQNNEKSIVNAERKKRENENQDILDPYDRKRRSTDQTFLERIINFLKFTWLREKLSNITNHIKGWFTKVQPEEISMEPTNDETPPEEAEETEQQEARRAFNPLDTFDELLEALVKDEGRKKRDANTLKDSLGFDCKIPEDFTKFILKNFEAALKLNWVREKLPKLIQILQSLLLISTPDLNDTDGQNYNKINELKRKHKNIRKREINSSEKNSTTPHERKRRFILTPLLFIVQEIGSLFSLVKKFIGMLFDLINYIPKIHISWKPFRIEITTWNNEFLSELVGGEYDKNMKQLKVHVLLEKFKSKDEPEEPIVE